MFIKILIIGTLGLIVGSLFSALFFMFKDKRDPKRAARALTLRVGLSISLFVLLLLGFYTGVITVPGGSP